MVVSKTGISNQKPLYDLAPSKTTSPKAQKGFDGRDHGITKTKKEHCSSRRRKTRSLDVGGIRINGVDPRLVHKGSLEIEIPLVEGKHKFAGPHGPVKIRVSKKSVAKVELKIRRDRHHKIKIEAAGVSVSPLITVRNPFSAFSDAEYNITTFAGNKLVDLDIKSVKIGENHTLSVKGKVSVLSTVQVPLKRKIRVDALKIFEEDLASWFQKQDSSDLTTSLEIGPWLQKLSPLIKSANYRLRLEIDKTAIGIRAESLAVSSAEKKASIDIAGTLGIAPDGFVFIAIDEGQTILKSGAGKVSAGGLIGLNTSNEKKHKKVEGQLDIDYRPISVDAKLDLPEQEEISWELRGKSNEVKGKLLFSSDGAKFKLSDNSTVSFKLDAPVQFSAPVVFGENQVMLAKTRLLTSGTGNVEFDGKYLRVTNGDLVARFVATDSKINIDGFKAKINGQALAEIAVHHMVFDSKDKSVAAKGAYLLGYHPSQKMREEFPGLSKFHHRSDFILHPDRSLRIVPRQLGPAKFFAPIDDLDGHPRRIVSARPTNNKPMVAETVQTKIAELTGAHVRHDNKVELLVDGIKSRPKRLELIRNAKKSIWFQTLILKNDDSGKETVQALVAATKRGVKVRVIIDSLGNLESFEHFVEENPLYRELKNADISVEIYSDSIERGFHQIFGVLKKRLEIADIQKLDDIMNPAVFLKALHRVALASKGSLKEISVSKTEQKKLARGLHLMFRGQPGASTQVVVDEIAKISKDKVLEAPEVIAILERLGNMHHRWHEKYLIVDGVHAIMGGLNVADEYMLGGTGQRVIAYGEERTAWRDIDVYFSGHAVEDVSRAFANNWRYITGRTLPIVKVRPKKQTKESAQSHERKMGKSKGKKVQFIQHRPTLDGDHHITNANIILLNSLGKGERAYFENAYFLPTGALKRFKEALISAAKRGIDVRVLTNGKTSSDLKVIKACDNFTNRELLEQGVRIYVRNDDRTIHSKVASFGGKVAAVSSWNADNRSAAQNSEALALIYDEKIAKELENSISSMLHSKSCRELKLLDIEYLPVLKEMKNAIVAIISDLL